MVPEGWSISPLEELAYVERGRFSARPRNDPKFYGGDIPFIQTGDITSSSGYLTTYTQTLNTHGLRVSKLFPAGTIFVTIAANIGDVALSTFDAAAPDSVVAVAPRKRVHREWLFQYLLTQKNVMERAATQNAQKNINLQVLRPLPILVPPLHEQRAIVDILSVWDSARKNLEGQIERLRERKRGLMQVLLTGKKRFTEYAHLAWRSAPLADYVASARKGKPASLNDAGRGVPYIGSAAFNGDYTSHTDDPSAVRCSAKDVLLLWDGEYAGKSTTGHVGAVGSTVVAITLKPGLDHGYLHNLLLFHNQRIRSVREGSGIPHMPSDFFTWFKPNLPPIEEQRTIASVLSTADDELRMLEEQLEACKLQKRGLMQQLLTGKKRVKAADSEALPA